MDRWEEGVPDRVVEKLDQHKGHRTPLSEPLKATAFDDLIDR